MNWLQRLTEPKKPKPCEPYAHVYADGEPELLVTPMTEDHVVRISVREIKVCLRCAMTFPGEARELLVHKDLLDKSVTYWH